MPIRFKHLAGVGAATALLLLGQQATAFTISPATTEPCCNPYSSICGPSMYGEWEIGAHALYFTPITCPYVYANAFTAVNVVGLDIQNGQAQLVPCRADWGFRVFGNYVGECTFVALSYQWIQVTTTRSVVAANLRIHGGNFAGPGKATGQTGIEYQNFDVRVGTQLLRKCAPSLYLYGNARWVDLSYRRTARSFITTVQVFEDVREKSQLEGGAVGIGCGGELDLWCNVGAFIDGNFLGVIGKRSLKNIRYRQAFVNVGALIEQQESYPSETCVIPELDCRIGLNYTYACGCWKLAGEIGYEIDYFWHGSVLPNLTSNALPGGTGAFTPVCEDLGFSGLFFGCRLIF